MSVTGLDAVYTAGPTISIRRDRLRQRRSTEQDEAHVV
jgi:hypothetical protein